MKTISATLQAAIENPHGVSPLVKLTVQKSRIFSASLTRDNPPAWAAGEASTISETPTPQDAAYFDAESSLISVSEVGGALKITIDGSATDTFDAAGISLLSPSKPALTADGYVFYIDSTGNLVRAPFDPAQAVALNTGCVGAGTTIETGYASGAIHAISATEIVVLRLDDGGIGVDHYSYSAAWTKDTWGYRIMFPTLVADDPYMVVTSAAAKLGTDVFVYQTDWSNGSVRGVKRDASGNWSDSFEAITSDLCKTWVGNAITANGYIHLVAQFERTGALNLNVTRNFCMRSSDGKTFAMDRFILVSSVGWRFLGVAAGDQLYFYATNRVIQVNGTYYFTTSPVDELVISGTDVISVRATAAEYSGEFEVAIANGAETYGRHALIKRGNRVIFSVGYRTTAGDEYVDYMTCNIRRIRRKFGDAKRSLQLTLVPEGVYKTELQTYPWYLELIGKSALRSSCESAEDFFVPENSEGAGLTSLAVDFWNAQAYSTGLDGGEDFANNGGVTMEDLIGTHATGIGTETQEIKEQLSLADHPEVTGVVTVDYYFTSRPYDDTAGFTNDEAEICLRVVDAETEEERVVTGTAVTGTTPPQSWPSTVAGSYPVQYQFDPASLAGQMDVGDYVKSVIIIHKAGNSTSTYPEHLEISGVSAQESDSGSTPWSESPAEGLVNTVLVASRAGTAKVLPLWNGSSNDAPPASWYQTGYDDSGWASAVLKTAGGSSPAAALPGSDGLWNDTADALHLEECLFRQEFALGANLNISNITLTFRADDLQLALYLNGTYLGQELTASVPPAAPGEPYNLGPDLIVNIDPSLLVFGGTNVIAVHVRNDNGVDNTSSPAWASFKLAADVPRVVQQLTLPASNRPYVMFSSVPYSAFNFDAWGNFEYTENSGNEQGNTYWGLVGFGTDGLSYLVCRYDKQGGRYELVKVRSGAEVLLATATHTPADLTDHTFIFQHRDGAFRLRGKVGTRWTVIEWDAPVSGPEYRWAEADGVLSESEDQVYHLGFYGYKSTPHFKINSFDISDCAGIVLLPGEDTTVLDGLTASGVIVIDGVKYSYAGKFGPSPAVNSRGPYQARNTGIWSGSPAWEFRWFDWDNGASDYAGYLMGSDNGHAHEIDGSLWQVYHDHGDSYPPMNDEYLRNRSRHYGSTVNGDYVGQPNRIYVGCGLAITGVIEGEPGFHQHRAVAHADADDEIALVEWAGASGEHDQTLRDLLDKICRSNGTQGIFPGDYTGPAKDGLLSVGAGGKVSIL